MKMQIYIDLWVVLVSLTGFRQRSREQGAAYKGTAFMSQIMGVLAILVTGVPAVMWAM